MATAATAASIGLSVPVSAAVTLNEDGTGLVGRGDALRALGWANDRLQTSATELDFVAETVSVTAESWTCVHASGEDEIVHERRTTTTVRADLVTSVERSTVTGAVVGFGLEGFAADAVTVAVVEGPALHACPGGEDWSRVPRSTERERMRTAPALELVHDGAAHRLPAVREDAA